MPLTSGDHVPAAPAWQVPRSGDWKLEGCKQSMQAGTVLKPQAQVRQTWNKLCNDVHPTGSS